MVQPCLDARGSQNPIGLSSLLLSLSACKRNKYKEAWQWMAHLREKKDIFVLWSLPPIPVYQLKIAFFTGTILSVLYLG